MNGRPPPFLLPAALLWWGWQAELLPWALVLGGLLEAARYLPMRWDLQVEDFRRLWNVTLLLFAGAGLYLLFAQEGMGTAGDLLQSPAQRLAAMGQASRAALRLLQWLPLVLSPFLLAYAWSRMHRLPWSTVAGWFARWRGRAGMEATAVPAESGFVPFYPYLVAVVFAASATDRNADWFFVMLTGMVAWALWSQRSRRFRWAMWSLSFAVAVAVAYAGQLGLLWAYRRLQQIEGNWLNRLAAEGFSPHGVATDIGAVGRRKASGRIVLRVRSETGSVPGLLREAVFTQFRSPNWSAGRREFAVVQPQPDLETWRFTTGAVPRTAATIVRYTRRGVLALALPDGVCELRQLAASQVETNRLTSARAEGLPALAHYEVRYAALQGFDAPPDGDDLDLTHLRPADRAAIERVSTALGLGELASRKTPREAVSKLSDFFLRGFAYSLYQPVQASKTGPQASPVGDFLLTTRRGHCEYFATATVLLLRAAGVPARYVVGHSVQERKGDWFVVRGRHGHAWCLAYLDGRWEAVDNTPGTWVAAEAEGRSFWEPVYDRFSAVWMAFAQWRQGGSQWRLYVFVIGVGVLAFMAWRELRGGKWRRANPAALAATRRLSGLGSDSEFYAILRQLERQHAPRPPGLTVRAWLGQRVLANEDSSQELLRLLQLHYRLRFDPAGLSAAEREELRSGCAAWSLAR